MHALTNKELNLTVKNVSPNNLCTKTNEKNLKTTSRIIIVLADILLIYMERETYTEIRIATRQ